MARSIFPECVSCRKDHRFYEGSAGPLPWLQLHLVVWGEHGFNIHSGTHSKGGTRGGISLVIRATYCYLNL
jgi:hypothetical protein